MTNAEGGHIPATTAEELAAGESSRDSEHLLTPMLRMVEEAPTHPLLAVRLGDRFVDRTVAQTWLTVSEMAMGLIDSGVMPGQRVALMAPTSPEWLEIDQAITAVGAVLVPIFETSSADQVRWILKDSGAVLAIVDKRETRASVADVVASCGEILCLEDGDLARLVRRGTRSTSELNLTDELDLRLAGLRSDSVASIVYTSGTTVRPKGCVLTHRNLSANVRQIEDALGGAVQPSDTVLLFLPMAHVLARITALYCLKRGTKIAFATSIADLADEFALAQPTLIAAVPRIFKKVYQRAQHKAEAAKMGWVFERAARTATVYSRQRAAGTLSWRLRAEHALFKPLIYDSLADSLGGHLRLAFSGGAPLDERLTSFFDGVGLRIYEGYGLTETSPLLTLNRVRAWRPGSVGPVVSDTELRLTADHEILVKGPQVFGGYWNNEAATRDVVDSDGWFHTGDLGTVDDEGFVYVTGRAKELLVTSSGKNVAPTPLEEGLRMHSLISQAVVVGDNRPFIAALVTIDTESFKSWAEGAGHPGASAAAMTDHPDLRREIQEAVDFANRSISRAESIRKFEILPRDFDENAGELTPTLKVRRTVILDRYASVITSMYDTSSSR